MAAEMHKILFFRVKFVVFLFLKLIMMYNG